MDTIRAIHNRYGETATDNNHGMSASPPSAVPPGGDHRNLLKKWMHSIIIIETINPLAALFLRDVDPRYTNGRTAGPNTVKEREPGAPLCISQHKYPIFSSGFCSQNMNFPSTKTHILAIFILFW